MFFWEREEMQNVHHMSRVTQNKRHERYTLRMLFYSEFNGGAGHENGNQFSTQLLVNIDEEMCSLFGNLTKLNSIDFRVATETN